nr:hypothetical protein [Tanacetum cinerariifolium]
MELIPPPILLLEVPQDYNASFAVPRFFIHSIYVIPCLYIRSLSVMLSRISFHVLYGRGVTIMVSEPGYETVSSKDLTCEDWMVNTRTNADLSAAVQNALQTLLPQIHAEIREEFRTSSGPSDSGGNPHRSLFILGLNALISKSPIHLRRRQLPLMRRIRFLTWRRSLMSWVVRMHSRLD